MRLLNTMYTFLSVIILCENSFETSEKSSSPFSKVCYFSRNPQDHGDAIFQYLISMNQNPMNCTVNIMFNHEHLNVYNFHNASNTFYWYTFLFYDLRKYTLQLNAHSICNNNNISLTHKLNLISLPN